METLKKLAHKLGLLPLETDRVPHRSSPQEVKGNPRPQE